MNLVRQQDRILIGAGFFHQQGKHQEARAHGAAVKADAVYALEVIDTELRPARRLHRLASLIVVA